MKNNIVSKYLKKFGLSKAKEVVYIMRTSDDEYPRNKYFSWAEYVKRPDLKKHWPFHYENCWFVCNDTLVDMQYQIDEQAREQKG